MGVDLSLKGGKVKLHSGFGNHALFRLHRCDCEGEGAAGWHPCPTTAAKIRAVLPEVERFMEEAWRPFGEEVAASKIRELREYVEEAERLEASGKPLIQYFSY